MQTNFHPSYIATNDVDAQEINTASSLNFGLRDSAKWVRGTEAQ